MQPDTLQRHFYGLLFRVAFLEKRGTEFQDWFVRLARAALGPDFQPVRPYGPMGDFKCDGHRVSTGTIFQCYAPDRLTANKLISKIRVDFNGAREHWKQDMNQWVLVHNGREGLPPTAVQYLNGLRKDHQEINIETWGETELRKLKENLDLGDLEALFGYAPTREEATSLGIVDLKPVIDALQQADPIVGDAPVVPPSADKLQRNSLSPDAAELLRWGRRKEPLVEKYFANSPLPYLGERIAEAFRTHYATLKDRGLTPDDILLELQEFVRGNTITVATREGAVLAVLSYFFERCDIFEDPEDSR